MALPDTKKRRSLLARVGASFLWFVVPGIAILLAAAYIVIALVWNVNPPVVPVSGGSMRPTLQPGDLVVLKSVDADEIEVGDIIAVTVPEDDVRRYDLQTPVIHRVHKILRDPEEGLRFKTKGDANAGVDVFATIPSNVIGRMEKRLVGWGYPFLFLRSRQGLIFIAAAVFVIIMYFLIGVWDERRAAAQGAAISLYTVLQETRDIKETLETGRPPARGPPSELRPTTPSLGRRPPGPVTLDSGDDDVNPVLRELVSAIDFYGQHLQSHTGVMVNLAKTTAELYQAAVEIRRALGSQPDADLPDIEFPPVVAPGSVRGPAHSDPEGSAATSAATPRRTPPPPPAATATPRRTTPPPVPPAGTMPRRTSPPPPPSAEMLSRRRTAPPPPPAEALSRRRTAPPPPPAEALSRRRTPPPPPPATGTATRRRVPPPPPPATPRRIPPPPPL